MVNDISHVLISEEEIKEKVLEIGSRITQDFQGKNVLLVSVLKGSIAFMADLMRAIKLPCSIDFMCVSSYAESSISSGIVKIIKDIDINLEGKDIIVVEDILDSGLTLNFITGILKQRKAASVTICTLLDKPERRKVKEIVPTYYGFVVPDEFVVGYGLDYAERYRNLPYIGVLKKSVYSK